MPVGPTTQNADVPLDTETAAANDQIASPQSLSEALGKLYAETGLFAIIVLATLAPLLVVIALLPALWHLNMCVGNLNPLLAHDVYGSLQNMGDAAIEVVIELFCMLVGLGLMLLDTLNRVFTRELLLELLVIIHYQRLFYMGSVFSPRAVVCSPIFLGTTCSTSC
jgi:hypothetical protein